MEHHTFVVGDTVCIPLVGRQYENDIPFNHTVSNLPNGLKLNFNPEPPTNYPFCITVEGCPTLSAIRDQPYRCQHFSTDTKGAVSLLGEFLITIKKHLYVSSPSSYMLHHTRLGVMTHLPLIITGGIPPYHVKAVPTVQETGICNDVDQRGLVYQPLVEGEQAIMVTVTDNRHYSVIKEFRIAVHSHLLIPPSFSYYFKTGTSSLVTLPRPIGGHKQEYAVSLYDRATGKLPDGLNFNPSTRVLYFNGRVRVRKGLFMRRYIGALALEYRVSDSTGIAVSDTVIVHIEDKGGASKGSGREVKI